MSSSYDYNLSPADRAGLVAPINAGACAQLFLFGAVVTVYWGFASSPTGRAISPLHRLAFYVAFLLAALESAFCVHDLIWYTTISTDSTDILYRGPGFTQASEPFIGAVQGALVQAVLGLRVLKVVKRPLVRYGLLVSFGCLIVLEILVGILVTIVSLQVYHGNFFTSFPIDFGEAIIAWMWLTAGADSIITLVYIYLIRQRLKRGTDTELSVFTLIAQGAIQSAAYTTIVALLTAILTQIFGIANVRTADISFAFWLCLPSLYALSLVSTLSIGERVTAQMRERNEEVIEIMVTQASLVEIRANGRKLNE